MKSVLDVYWKDWCWSWSSNTLATWCKELTHWKRPWCWKDWRWEEKGMTEDEMAGWRHWLDGHEFVQAPGVGDGQGSLACCNPWGHKELDTTERLIWTELNCSPPSSSSHGILQARILEWVAMPSSRASSRSRDWTCISCITGQFFTAEPPEKPTQNSVKRDMWPKKCRALSSLLDLQIS